MRTSGEPPLAPARTERHGPTLGAQRGHTHTTLSSDTRVDWADAFALVSSLRAAAERQADRPRDQTAFSSIPIEKKVWELPEATGVIVEETD